VHRFIGVSAVEVGEKAVLGERGKKDSAGEDGEYNDSKSEGKNKNKNKNKKQRKTEQRL
jgi:hypothetical protein